MSQSERRDLGRAVHMIECAVEIVAPAMAEEDVHDTAVNVVADVTGMLPSAVEEEYLAYQDSLPKAHLPSWWPKGNTEGGQQ